MNLKITNRYFIRKYSNRQFHSITKRNVRYTLGLLFFRWKGIIWLLRFLGIFQRLKRLGLRIMDVIRLRMRLIRKLVIRRLRANRLFRKFSKCSIKTARASIR